MTETQLTEIETELYDRQIRLWGIESQEKLRAANVLLIGVRGLGSEIAKNILLSGINSLTILDNGVVTQNELTVNFLLSPESLGENIAKSVLPKAEALNPLVQLKADNGSIDDKTQEYFRPFTIVIATRLSIDEISAVSNWCRLMNVKFITCDAFGMFGCMISDFQEHGYYEDHVYLPKKRKLKHKEEYRGEPIIQKVHSKIKYPGVRTIIKNSKIDKEKKCRNVYYYLMLVLLQFRTRHERDPQYSSKEKDLDELRQIWEGVSISFGVEVAILKEEVFGMLFGEIVPICSIIGGVVAQEAIKAVSGREVPINNVFLLDPFTYFGREVMIGHFEEEDTNKAN